MTPKEVYQKYNLTRIHHCKKCAGKIVNISIDDVGITRCGYCNQVVNYMDYKTLEMDLIDCFTKRCIEVDTLDVTEGATVYTIKVKRE